MSWELEHPSGRRAGSASPCSSSRAQSFLAAGFSLLGGGVPITRNGQVIGAVGIGGGSPEQDVQVAEAGLAALG